LRSQSVTPNEARNNEVSILSHSLLFSDDWNQNHAARQWWHVRHIISSKFRHVRTQS
jgi:hypothetical protein